MKKKAYVKPRVYVEKFELEQHIANCAFELNSAEHSCPFVGDEDSFPGLVIIDTSINACDNTSGEYYCYENNGEEGMNTFDS